MVHLHFGAKDLFEIASSCINKLLPVFLEVFEAVLESSFWNGVLSWLSEWPECQHSEGLSLLISVVGVRKNARSQIWSI
jgi:hypothetical protein